MSQTPRPAPYPADTRAKGWRFEIDYEKVEQSDTWDLAAEVPMAQHSLLMMWLISWRQEPCGSFPADEALIRSKCKVPTKMWPALRPILLRGWWLADDGRLYHDTITARVLEMLEYRRKTAERVAAFKLKQREQHVGNALLEGEQQGKNDTGTGTGTDLKEEKKGARKRSPSFDAEGIELPAWLDRELWEGWCKERASRGKPITERAAKEQLKSLDEYRRNGHTPARVISHAIASGNQGLFPPPVIRGPAGQAPEAKVVEVWKPSPPLTPEERAASQLAKERALGAVKIIKASA